MYLVFFFLINIVSYMNIDVEKIIFKYIVDVNWEGKLVCF